MTDNNALAMELEALSAKATEAPWGWQGNSHGEVELYDAGIAEDGSLFPVLDELYVYDSADGHAPRLKSEDAALIVFLRNNLPTILSALRAQPAPAAGEVVVYKHSHPDYPDEYDKTWLTDADKADGWTETPLYTADMLERLAVVSHETGSDDTQAALPIVGDTQQPECYECAVLLESLCAWLLHRFGPDSPEGQEAAFRLTKALAAIAAMQSKGE